MLKQGRLWKVRNGYLRLLELPEIPAFFADVRVEDSSWESVKTGTQTSKRRILISPEA